MMTSSGYSEGVHVCKELERLGKIEDLFLCLSGLKAAQQGQTKLSEGDFKAALSFSKDAVKIFNKISEAKYLLAICKADISAAYGHLKDYENAIITAKECIELVNGKKEFAFSEGAANMNLGMSLLQLGIQGDAIIYLKKARELLKESPDNGQYLSVIDNNLEVLNKQGGDPAFKNSSMKTSNKNCFIATAVYRDPEATEVIHLRRFRDEKLSLFWIGKILIKLYYSGLGQIIGKLLSSKMKWMIPIFKKILDKLVLFIQNENAI